MRRVMMEGQKKTTEVQHSLLHLTQPLSLCVRNMKPEEGKILCKAAKF